LNKFLTGPLAQQLAAAEVYAKAQREEELLQEVGMVEPLQDLRHWNGVFITQPAVEDLLQQLITLFGGSLEHLPVAGEEGEGRHISISRGTTAAVQWMPGDGPDMLRRVVELWTRAFKHANRTLLRRGRLNVYPTGHGQLAHKHGAGGWRAACQHHLPTAACSNSPSPCGCVELWEWWSSGGGRSCCTACLCHQELHGMPPARVMGTIACPCMRMAPPALVVQLTTRCRRCSS
jgi:hypothetical protein